MNAYEQKQAERAERLRARATKKRAEANHLSTKHDALLRVMNGTPVLRGHHSERRHVRDLERIDRDKRKSFEAAREADALERRAIAIESNDAVSSDDPEAIAKLRARLNEIENCRELAKKINATIRRRKTPEAVRAALEAASQAGELTLTPGGIAKLCVPDAFGDYGVPSYRLRNWASEVRRISARIVELERQATAPARGPAVYGDVTVSEADNRVRLAFPGKPAPEVIAKLKSRGFRWSPTNSAWQRQATPAAWNDAISVAASAAKT